MAMKNPICASGASPFLDARCRDADKVLAQSGLSPEGDAGGRSQASRFTRRSRRALLITETDEKLIAAAANIGEISSPRNG